MIRFADDKAIVSSTEKGLQQLMDDLNRVTKEYGTGMKISVKKIRVICISHNVNCRMNIR